MSSIFSPVFKLLVVFFVLASPVFAEEPAKAAEPTQATVNDAVARLKPALVRIHVVTTEYSDGREMKMEASGSGAIISKEGYVVTNHHVAGHATRIFCTLSDREEIEATLVGADPLTDIAVIQMHPDKAREFSAGTFGNSDAVRIGDPVLAMGCPMALSQSVTLGIVSNTEMIAPEWVRNMGGVQQDGEDVGALVKWIGHDAEILPGNSGGPLANLAGEIIGINELQMGLGGAIPGNLVKAVADELIAKGKVTRAWLGMRVQPHLKRAEEQRGVLVSGVLGDSPAALGGMQAGDLIVKIGDQPVNVRFGEEMPDFNRIVAGLPIDKPVSVDVVRGGASGGASAALTMTPVERENAKPKEFEIKAWGITASNLSRVKAKEMKRASQAGVLVTSVRSGGPASEAKPPIVQKDILVEVDGKPVRTVGELQDITRALTEGKSEPIPVLTAYERKTQRYVTVVKVGIKEIEDPGMEVKKAWLPIETQVLTHDIAVALKQPDLKGFVVTAVYPGSTAEKAGLQVGDYITAVDDEKLTASAVENYEELAALIRQYKVGDTANLAVLRAGASVKVPVELVRSPKLSREMKEYRDEKFDFSVRDVSFFDRAREQWPADQAGVMISEVKPGGWAALGEVSVGDLILRVDAAAVGDLDAFEAKMKEIAAAKPSTVVLQVQRGIYTLFIELEPKWDSGQS